MSDHLSLYLLKRKDEYIDYDEMAGCVVAAFSPNEARGFAAEVAGDEGDGTWTDTSRTTCRILSSDYRLSTTAGVVLRDFRAG